MCFCLDLDQFYQNQEVTFTQFSLQDLNWIFALLDKINCKQSPQTTVATQLHLDNADVLQITKCVHV